MYNLRKLLEEKGLNVSEVKTNKEGYNMFRVDDTLFKKVDEGDLKGEAFLEIRPIDVVFYRETITFEFEGKLYLQIHLHDNMKVGDMSLMKSFASIYIENDALVMLTPFKSIRDIFKELNRESPHAKELLEYINTKIGVPELSSCKKGFFHGDIHYENLLSLEGETILIDFDNVKNTYAALNLAYLYFASHSRDYALNHNKKSLLCAIKVKKYFLEVCSKPDRDAFNYFTLISIGLYILQNVSNKKHNLADLKKQFDKYLTWNTLVDIRSK